MPSETPESSIDFCLECAPRITEFQRHKYEAARAELAALREQLKHLKAWKGDQQKALITCAAMLLEAGYKGDGLIDGLRWALDDAKQTRAISKDIEECDEQIKKQARNAALDEAAKLVKGWHISKGGYENLAEAILAMKGS